MISADRHEARSHVLYYTKVDMKHIHTRRILRSRRFSDLPRYGKSAECDLIKSERSRIWCVVRWWLTLKKRTAFQAAFGRRRRRPRRRRKGSQSSVCWRNQRRNNVQRSLVTQRSHSFSISIFPVFLRSIFSGWFQQQRSFNLLLQEG